MTTEKSLEYTAEAQTEVDVAIQAFVRAIEQDIVDEKFIPGETGISVTASDVRRTLGKIQIVSRRKVEIRKLVVSFYAVIGLVVAAAGIAYPWLFRLYMSPIQISLIATGLLMSAAAFVLKYWMDSRGRNIESAMEYRDQLIIDHLMKNLRGERYERSYDGTIIKIKEYPKTQSERPIEKAEEGDATD